jgi:hypothetical protein
VLALSCSLRPSVLEEAMTSQSAEPPLLVLRIPIPHRTQNPSSRTPMSLGPRTLSLPDECFSVLTDLT